MTNEGTLAILPGGDRQYAVRLWHLCRAAHRWRLDVRRATDGACPRRCVQLFYLQPPYLRRDPSLEATVRTFIRIQLRARSRQSCWSLEGDRVALCRRDCLDPFRVARELLRAEEPGLRGQGGAVNPP